jgi:type IV pilus assembly protein PilM
MWGLSKSHSLVGVDIGSSSIKAVQLRKKGRQVQLVSAGITPLAPDAIVDGDIMDTLSVSSAISKLFEENNIATRYVAASVSGRAVMVKRVSVTAPDHQEWTDAIPAEVQRQFSSDPSELNYDFVDLGPDSAPNSQAVMLIGARREKVAAYTGVLSQAGAIPQVVDIDAFAVQGAFEAGYQPDAERTFALLNVGSSMMNVNIVRNEEPIFTRDIPFGGRRYTESLQKALDLGYDEAEKVKLGEEHPQADPAAREAALALVSDSLISEIRTTFNFFAQMNGASAIDQCYLSGGTARLPGLVERIGERLKIPVEILDPLRGISLNEKGLNTENLTALAPRLAVAVGLALRSFD